jgi:hypothetical protein
MSWQAASDLRAEGGVYAPTAAGVNGTDGVPE